MGRPKKKILLHIRLRMARDGSGLSVHELTREADVHYGTYVKMENGVSDNPTIKNLARIARVLGVGVDELVQDMDWNEEKRGKEKERDEMKEDEKGAV